MDSRPPDTRTVSACPADLEALTRRLDDVRRATSGARFRLAQKTAATRLSSHVPEPTGPGLRSRSELVLGKIERFEHRLHDVVDLVGWSRLEVLEADVIRGQSPAFDQAMWWFAHRAARLWQEVAQGATIVAALPGVVSGVLHGDKTVGRWGANQEGRAGDLGGSLTSRPVGPWSATTGRQTIADALVLAGDGDSLAPDEFAIVAHSVSPGRYTIILPGVVDLSRPRAGLDPAHRSVRDLDMSAVPSAAIGGSPDPYAAMVAEALERVDVPVGSEISIVGHSYGAAAALSLARNPAFNRRYDVRAVVAAGYYIDGAPPFSPETLVVTLENENDLVVAAEGLVFNSVLFDASDPVGLHANGRDHHVVRFAGGTARLGHDPRLYSQFVASGQSSPIEHVAHRLETEGFTGTGALMAVDVSVPEDEGVPIAWNGP